MNKIVGQQTAGRSYAQLTNPQDEVSVIHTEQIGEDG